MKHSEGGASKQTPIYVLVLGALIALNLLYFLSTHSKILEDVQAQQIGDLNCQKFHIKHVGPISNNYNLAAGSSSRSRADGSAPGRAGPAAFNAANTAAGTLGGGAATADAVRYLKQVVFYDKTRLPRKPLERFWLEQTKAPNKTFEEYRDKVATYLKSSEFKQQWDALKSQVGNDRGIVMSAGGEYYLPQAVVLLRILRHHLRSTLPVELFWYGDEEMDVETLQNLKAEFGPLEGYDVAKDLHPAHHFPGAKLKGFPMKPYALLKSRFKEAFLLDCDVVLRKDPAYMFDAPLYKERGNYFWDDIYGTGMVNEAVFEYVGLNKSVKGVLDEGKGDFNRYAESGQIMINRAMHLDILEWTWFLNSFSKGFIYDFMYGDKDTYGVAFGLAGKAHLYQQLNTPPGGIFTGLATMGWKPGSDQMNKQGNWWLQGLVHYDHLGEALLIHRVTGEVTVAAGQAPPDEIITPPIPHSWSMWYMGYGPGNSLQRTIDIMNYNVTYLLATATPGQPCPLAAWSAYWTLRTHGVPIDRNATLEKQCNAMLDAQYGPTAAGMIRKSQLIEHPLRLVVNSDWDKQVDGGWNAPKNPMWGVPLNQTSAHIMWQNLNASVAFAKDWIYTQHKGPVLEKE